MGINPKTGKDEPTAPVLRLNEPKDANPSSNWFAQLPILACRAQFKLVQGGKQDGIGSGSPLNTANSRGHPSRP